MYKTFKQIISLAVIIGASIIPLSCTTTYFFRSLHEIDGKSLIFTRSKSDWITGVSIWISTSANASFRLVTFEGDRVVGEGVEIKGPINFQHVYLRDLYMPTTTVVFKVIELIKDGYVEVGVRISGEWGKMEAPAQLKSLAL